MMGKISAVWVRLTVWVGAMQLDGMKGGVIGKISTVRVRVVVWVFEMQFGRRTGGEMGMRLTMLDSCSR